MPSPRDVVWRHLLVMIAAIVVLDAIAVSIFFGFHFNQVPGPRQNTFVGIWMLLSAVVVAIQLRKIRRARLGAMQAARDAKGRPSGSGGPPAPGGV